MRERVCARLPVVVFKGLGLTRVKFGATEGLALGISVVVIKVWGMSESFI